MCGVDATAQSKEGAGLGRLARGWSPAVALAAALAVAVYSVITGWEIPPSTLSVVVGWGLMAVAAAVLVGQHLVARSQRQGIVAGPTALLQSVQGVRRSSLFAIGLSVLVFSNCAAATGSGTSAQLGLNSDPANFWLMTAAFLPPILVALALPALLATLIERSARRGQADAAFRYSRFHNWAAVVIILVALGSAYASFVFGISYCFFGTSPGTCAAGAGGVGNVFAISSLLLLWPYMTMVEASVASLRTSNQT